MKDTLFLSKAESERMVAGRGGVPALGPEPERDRVLVERVGELGQRKIPGLRLTGWVPSVQHNDGWRGCTEAGQTRADERHHAGEEGESRTR